MWRVFLVVEAPSHRVLWRYRHLLVDGAAQETGQQAVSNEDTLAL